MGTTTLNQGTRGGMVRRGRWSQFRLWLALAGSLAALLDPSAAFALTGVGTNLPLNDLSGWTLCYRDTYNTSTFLPVALDECRQGNLLLACRPIGGSTLTVAAHAPRDDVLFPTGRGNTPHVANGVGWYFDEQWSWGFAPEGDPITRNSCDTLASSFDGLPGPDADKRLCWHTNASFLVPGWRCGELDSLNSSTSIERVILQADAVPPQSAVCGNGMVDPGEDCDNGGLCVGSTTAGQTCFSDDDCQASGVCDGGTRIGVACTDDDECPGSHCARCKTFGGDGCAANCTLETDVLYRVIPGSVVSNDLQPITSGTVLFSEDAPQLPIGLTGSQVLTIGKERNGQIPAVVKAAGAQFSNVVGNACACVRGVDAKTCGGTLFEADGVTRSQDCSDGYTAGASVCPVGKRCAAVHGPGNSASGLIGCNGITPINVNVTHDCNGTAGGLPADPFVGWSGLGLAGSASLLSTVSISTQVGNCPADFCSDPDPFTGTPMTIPMTTGNAGATVRNANNFPGLNIGPQVVTGAPFSCSALQEGSADGSVLVSAFAKCDDPDLRDIAGIQQLVARPPTPPRCGNGRVDRGEDCDDGGTCVGGALAGRSCTMEDDCGATEPGMCLGGVKRGALCASDSDCPGSDCVRCANFGGDGCAANCTLEHDVAYDLVPGTVEGGVVFSGTSGVTLVSEVFPQLPLPITGTQTLTIGKERDGEIPVVVKAESFQVPSMSLGGIGCACMRPVPLKTCGGTLFEADGVTPSVNCSDGFSAGPTVCPSDRRCAFVHGAGNSAAGVIGCAGLAGADVTLSQDCGSEFNDPSPPLLAVTGNGPPGSVVLFSTLAFTTKLGSCGGGFCTATEPPAARGTPVTVPLTTGAATTVIDNANGVAEFRIGPRTTRGVPFSCQALGGPSPSVRSVILAGAFPGCDLPMAADSVIITELAGAASPTPAPTNTPTPTQMPTPTPPPVVGGAVLGLGQATLITGQRSIPVPVFLNNAVTVRGVQFTITDVPDEVSLRTTGPCAVAPRAAGLTCSANQTDSGIRIVILAGGVTGIAPGSGQIATVFLDDTAPFCAAGSPIDLGLSQTAIAGEAGAPVAHNIVNGLLLCDCKGDIDADRETDIFDALSCIDFILDRRTPSAAEMGLADLTCDGEIDIFDCIGIVDVILGLGAACPLCG